MSAFIQETVFLFFFVSNFAVKIFNSANSNSLHHGQCCLNKLPTVIKLAAYSVVFGSFHENKWKNILQLW